MDRFNKQLLSTYSVPSTVLGTGLIEMDGTCSQLQRNSQPNRAKCHITKSMHVKCYHKGKEQWSQHRDRSYRLSLERYTSISRSLYLAPDFPKLQWLPLAKLKSPKSSLRFFPSNELRAINQYPFPFPWQAFLWANPLLEKAVKQHIHLKTQHWHLIIEIWPWYVSKEVDTHWTGVRFGVRVSSWWIISSTKQ